MDVAAFRASLADSTPPPGLTAALQVLWLDGHGDWEGAHEIAQELPDPDGAWLHAYLHRKEGDLPNAGYWYRRAGRPVARGSLDDEWCRLAAYYAAASAAD